MASTLQKFSAVFLSAVILFSCPAFAAEKSSAKKTSKGGEEGEFDIFDVKSKDLPDKKSKNIDDEFPMPDFNEKVAPPSNFTKDLFDEKDAPAKPAPAPVAAKPAVNAAPAKSAAPVAAAPLEPVVNPEIKAPEQAPPVAPVAPVEPQAAAPVADPVNPAPPANPAPEVAQPAVPENPAHAQPEKVPAPSAAAPTEVTSPGVPVKLENIVPEAGLSAEEVSNASNLKQHLYNFLKSFSPNNSVVASGAPAVTPSSVGDYKTISPDEYANMNNAIPPANPAQPQNPAGDAPPVVPAAPAAPVADNTVPSAPNAAPLQPDAIAPVTPVVVQPAEPAKAVAGSYTAEQIKSYVGTCAGIDAKIKDCAAFECTMPKAANSNVNVSIKVSPLDGGNCGVTSTVADEAPVNCKFDAGSKEKLSQKLAQYFQSGTPEIDFKKDYPIACPSAKSPQPVAIKSAKEDIKAPEKPAAPENKISDADKAYMAMMDEKSGALPKNKQLSDATTGAIKAVTPSLVTPKKNKAAETDYISITHGKDISTVAEVDGEASSESGIKISSKNPASLKADVATKKKMDQAYRALLAGQLVASETLYKEVLEKDPENKDALFGLAAAYQKNSQFEQARDIYTKILKKEPNNKEILNNFLVIVAEEAPEDALIELQKLERINSDFSPIPAQIAMIYLKTNDPKKAERYLRRAVILSPDNITYKYNLAITEDRLQDYPQAVRLYRQIVEAVDGGAVIPGSIQSIRERLGFLEQKTKLE
jgi:Tfp pilus assembly protein PilF